MVEGEFVPDIHCPSCGGKGFRVRSLLASSPEYLLVKANRFVIEGITQKKLNALIKMPT
jgi:hypothetical protein